MAKHTDVRQSALKEAFLSIDAMLAVLLSHILCAKCCKVSDQRKHLCTTDDTAGGKFTKGSRWPLKLESLSLFVDILVEL